MSAAPDLVIAPVAADGLEAVLPLIAAYQSFYGVKRPDDDRNRRFFRRFLAPSDHGLLLVARRAGRPVGFACLYWTFSSIAAAEVVLLADLLVAPEARGAGIGRALIEEAAAVSRRRGAHHLEWLTHIDNRVAQRLYESMGADRSAWFGYEIRLGDAAP